MPQNENLNKLKIAKLAEEMLDASYQRSKAKIKKALKSGAVDVEGWNEDITPMILPKTLVVAILEDEAEQYACRGTSFQRSMRREANNIKLLL